MKILLMALLLIAGCGSKATDRKECQEAHKHFGTQGGFTVESCMKARGH